MADISFTEEDIIKACAELKSGSAAGADGIPASLLKICRKELAKPLYLLWRSSLDQGSIPSDLLLVLICPVHKGGSRGIPKNYRPVALTSHIVKVFERVIRKALVDHLERSGYFPDGQHGFRALRSILTQLLSFWDSILDKLEDGAGVDVIYTDFSKAFDKVETGVLLHEIKDCKVTGKVGCWLASFLDPASRQQAVVVDGTVSSLSPVISGVPQGTVLGPVLFLIHIRGIASGLSAQTTASSFADDTRVQRGIRSDQDCSDLQADLQVIYDWASRVNMHFNGDKFECLRFWSGSGATPAYQYKGPDNSEIEVKTNLKDLGVQLSSDLSFKLQVEKTQKLYSQERRRERYMIVFLWKISQRMVEGYSVTFSNNVRRGRTVLPNSVVASAPAVVRRARETTLGVKGAKLFNLLPISIRNIDSDNVETFKAELDKFLSLVPDQPTIAGQARAAETNSLLHQIPLLRTSYDL